MIDVLLDFDERVAQIEKYLIFIWISESKPSLRNLGDIGLRKIFFDDESEIELNSFLSENGNFNIDTELVKILKSNSILLLYNLIEGTINSIMNEYFGSISNVGAKYKEFSIPIKKTWLKYKHKSFGTSTKKTDDYIIGAIESILEEVVNIEPKEIKDSQIGTKIIRNYDAYSAEIRTNEFSGNLDARKIKKIFKLYGLPQTDQDCNSMVRVKNKRNSLAHGNENFAKAGSDFTVEELFKINKEITEFLKELLSETEVFINDKMYMINNSDDVT